MRSMTALLALLAASSQSLATLVAFVVPSNAGSVNITAQNDVDFTRSTAYSGVAELWVLGTPSDNIRFLQTFGANAGYTTNIFILGDASQGGATQIGNVRVILKNSAALVSVRFLDSAGNLGQVGQTDKAIQVDFIGTVGVSGSVFSEIQATSSRIDLLVIGGDLLAPVNCHPNS